MDENIYSFRLKHAAFNRMLKRIQRDERGSRNDYVGVLQADKANEKPYADWHRDF